MNLPEGSRKAALVEAMFDRIAPRYDLMNRVMTLGMDARWRRHAIAELGIAAGDRVLDLACGTGDLGREAARAGARVLGIDFAARMLRRAAERVPPSVMLVRGDALRLPLREGSFDAVVSGFALRNFVDLGAVFAECFRVLRPGGRFALLEVDTPRSNILRLGHGLYFHWVVPAIGRIADREAYSYLPSSTGYLPDEARMVAMLRAAGFSEIRKRRLLGGAVQLLTGRR